MKNFLSLIAVPVLLIACNKEVNKPEEPASVGQIVISPTVTKVTETNFEQGDAIGLTIVRESGTWAENARLSFDGGVFSGELNWYPDKDASTLKAYYPYSENLPTTFSVALDQRSGTSSSDFVAAIKNNVTPSEEAVPITFSHKLSRILITLDNQSGKNVEGVTIGGVIPTATVSENFEIGTANVEAANIQALKNSDSKYRLIIVPQTAALTVMVTVDGNVMTQVLTSTELMSGMEYKVSVIVYEDSINLVLSGDITNWNDGGDIPFEV